MNKVISLILWIFISAFLYPPTGTSQPLLKNYKQVDKLILAAKDSINTISELSNYINKQFDNEEYKCRAIFKWISSSISYDVKSMYSINLKVKKGELAKALLKRKRQFAWVTLYYLIHYVS